MIVSIYRWRLKPELRDAFVAAWSEATLMLRTQMGACIAERFDALELDAVADLWAAFPASE